MDKKIDYNGLLDNNFVSQSYYMNLNWKLNGKNITIIIFSIKATYFLYLVLPFKIYCSAKTLILTELWNNPSSYKIWNNYLG